MKEVEQQHPEHQQIEINHKHARKGEDSANKTKKLLRLQAAQLPLTRVAYTVTTLSLEGSNSKDHIIPLPPRVNRGMEPHSETHKLQEMKGEQKVSTLAGNLHTSKPHNISSSSYGLKEGPEPKVFSIQIEVKNTAHPPRESVDYNSVSTATLSKQKRLQGLCYKGGEGFFSGR